MKRFVKQWDCLHRTKPNTVQLRFVSDRKLKRQEDYQQHVMKKYQHSEESTLTKLGYEAVIGLEVHAQIHSNSKLFSASSTRFNNSHPNSQVSLVDAAYPGVLPVINEFCIRQAIKTGIALQATVQKVSQFDRKHYFYADMPQEPLILGGSIKLELPNGKSKNIRLQRIQLEQDSGKSLHDQEPSLTLIDLNRAGIALMEIITQPDISSSLEAEEFIKKLQFLLRHIQTSSANMEEGELRCDVNVSVHKIGSALGTRCEIKNVSSVAYIAKAIDYEIKRQIELLEEGKQVDQETRLFNSKQNKTVLMRSKENAPDYRYFPDPDIPPLCVSDELIEQVRTTLPELPDAIQERLVQQYGLSNVEASKLQHLNIVNFFEQMMHHCSNGKMAANWILNKLFSQLNKEQVTLEKNGISALQMASLVEMLDKDLIPSKIGEDVLSIMFQGDKRSAQEICTEKNWRLINSEHEISALCAQVIECNHSAVEKVQCEPNNKNAFGFLVSQVLKLSSGQANPRIVVGQLNQLLHLKKQ